MANLVTRPLLRRHVRLCRERRSAACRWVCGAFLLLSVVVGSAQSFSLLRTFSGHPAPFAFGRLVATNNTLYGALAGGGSYGYGSIFRIDTDGAGPLPSLILSGGALYGTTESGGGAGVGTLFALDIAPRMVVDDASYGSRSNAFGFNVTGYSNQVIAIESCTDPNRGSWLSLETNVLQGDPLHFADLHWTNYPQRYYRIRAD